MGSLGNVNSGDSANSSCIQQLIDVCKGTVGAGNIPISFTAINDSVNFALDVKQLEATNGRAFRIIDSSGGVAFQADATGLTMRSIIGGLTISTGGLTVSASGITVTGNSTITGTLSGLTGLTVASGGITVTGNSTITGTLSGLTALTTANVSVTTGNLNITGASSLVFGSGSNATISFNPFVGTAQIIGATVATAFRDNANAANNLLISDAGLATVRAGLTVTAGALTFGAAASQIIPGATTLSLRDTGNANDNLLMTDAGLATVRSAVRVTNGGTNYAAAGAIRLNNGTPGQVSWRNAANSADLNIGPDGSDQLQLGGAWFASTTVGAAGAGAALPATPASYLRCGVNGTVYKIPLYTNA